MSPDPKILSQQIQQHQRRYLAKLRDRCSNDPTRLVVFAADGEEPREINGARGKGRPRTRCITGVADEFCHV